MPIELVTVAQALMQIRGDEDADGEWLEMWIPIVSESVRLYLKDEWRLYLPERDSNGEIICGSDGDPIPMMTSNGPLVHPVVAGAVLLELTNHHSKRGDVDENRGRPEEYGFALSRPAAAMLANLRRPTVA